MKYALLLFLITTEIYSSHNILPVWISVKGHGPGYDHSGSTTHYYEDKVTEFRDLVSREPVKYKDKLVFYETQLERAKQMEKENHEHVLVPLCPSVQLTTGLSFNGISDDDVAGLSKEDREYVESLSKEDREYIEALSPDARKSGIDFFRATDNEK